MITLSNTQDLTLTLETLIPKCKTLNHLKQIQSSLITLGHAQAQFFAFRLIRFCTVSLSNLPYARIIFNSLNSPNVYIYSAMINAYFSGFDYLSVFDLYKGLVCKGRPRPNHFVYPNVLKSCSGLMGLDGVRMVHAQVVKTGFGVNPVVKTALVDCYSRVCIDVWSARKVFDEMSERNVVLWTAMISGYVRVGEMGNAVCLFDLMPERDVPAWNAIIAGCTQNGLFSEALFYLRRMVGSCEVGVGVRPNEVSFACVLSACGHTGMLLLGKEIHGYIVRNGLELDSYMLNALIDLYGKCGCLKEARRVFETTRGRSLTSWNSMINCCALHGKSENALDIFDEMVQVGVKPDGITFIGLLNACTHVGLVEKGYYFYNLMTNVYGIDPQIEHYGCMVDLLGRAGRFEEVMNVIKSMKVEPDEVIWGALLNGCKIHRNVELAELALKKLIEIDPNNGGYISMLANLYVELAKWDEVRGVRMILKERNIQKIPGCSWIELDSGLHQFHSADYSHPRTEEIYSTLESLFDVVDRGQRFTESFS